MTSGSATKLERRRTLQLSGLVAACSLTALAGCGDEGPGDEGSGDDGSGDDEDQADHPDEVGNESGGGGGPIDEDDSTGVDSDENLSENETNETDEDGQ